MELTSYFMSKLLISGIYIKDITKLANSENSNLGSLKHAPVITILRDTKRIQGSKAHTTFNISKGGSA